MMPSPVVVPHAAPVVHGNVSTALGSVTHGLGSGVHGLASFFPVGQLVHLGELLAVAGLLGGAAVVVSLRRGVRR